MSSFGSFLSELYHLVAYRLKKPKMQLENGMFIISIDVDVGSKELGMINKGKNDANVSRYISEYRVGEIEEQALPLFVDLFKDIEIPVTFAMRGQLSEVDDSFFKLLRKSPVEHDIGAHGYYHRHFRKLSYDEAKGELDMIAVSMKRLSIIPRSFVFPDNSVAHVNLLEKYGYKCFRGYGDFMNDGMYIKKHDQIYDVHPSLYLNQSISSIFLKKIVDIAITKKLPFHIWFHLWNFGETEEIIQRNIRRMLSPLLSYAKRKMIDGELTFETMLSAAETFERREIY